MTSFGAKRVPKDFRLAAMRDLDSAKRFAGQRNVWRLNELRAFRFGVQISANPFPWVCGLVSADVEA
jgi:hypothetical protein